MACVPLFMVLASVWMGASRYLQVKHDMEQDLNQALQHLVLHEHGRQWLSDTLSSLPPEGILTPSGQKDFFRRHLSLAPLKDTAHFSVCKAGAEGCARQFPEEAVVISDTLMWSVSQAGSGNVMVALKAFANPSFASIFSHSRPAVPLGTFLSGICLLAFLLCASSRSSSVAPSVPAPSLCLTPMQEQLMEMFRNAPEHTLTKEEICTALWPKKDNPEDTLYTFISRLKTSLRKQSDLQIINRRGREYALVEHDVTD